MQFNNINVYLNGKDLGYFKEVVINDCEARLYNQELENVFQFDSMEESDSGGSLMFNVKVSNYYFQNGIMAWDIIDQIMDYYHGLIDESEAFYLGNILKYLFRLKTKGQFESDIDKIKVYCDRLLEHNK